MNNITWVLENREDIFYSSHYSFGDIDNGGYCYFDNIYECWYGKCVINRNPEIFGPTKTKQEIQLLVEKFYNSQSKEIKKEMWMDD